MLTSQTFLKKTKRGNILKIVREHYLRNDIWCGSELCKKCQQKNNDIVLDKSQKSLSDIVPDSHYIVLDTNIVLNQIDILEEEGISNVIILQTVLKEVKHRSSAVFKRLKDIIANPRKKFYVFVNEHHKETYIERNEGEKVNDRNDRAIRVSTIWYSNHLNNAIKVILLTDDKDNKQKALDEGIPAFSAEEYVKSLSSFPTLVDKLSKKEYEIDGKVGGEPIFPCHYTPNEIHEGIKNKSLLFGQFLSSRENFLEGTVNIDGEDKSVLIQGRDALNRAVDGDTVAVKLLPESQWIGSSELILQDEGEEEDMKTEQEILSRLGSKTVEKKPTGTIVGIIKRKWRQYCGILQSNVLEGSVRHIFVPAESKIPKVRIETRQFEFLKNQRIVVAIDSWPRHSRYPLGHFVRALGPIGDKDTENEVLLLEHDVPHSKFSEAVLSYLPKLPWTITEEVSMDKIILIQRLFDLSLNRFFIKISVE
ncbi:hypothetical protein RUM43_010817 [Polyplax serrata]|uniref:Protein DIS3 homolog n=1 Tax=Polyplax serrata TaxID=468196 RepID=A0AAN8NXI1_POLSC